MLRNRVREFRHLHQLTQDELGKRVGVTKQAISALETDPTYRPSSDLMIDLATYFNCDLGVLFYIDRTLEQDKVAV